MAWGTLLPIILFCIFGCAQHCKYISPFTARKLTHLFSGWLLLSLQPYERQGFLHLFIMIFALGVPTFNFLFPRMLRFATARDKGIAYFGFVVFLWELFSLPFVYLAPLLISDPAAALVGHYVRSPVVYGNKSISGSLSFFFSAWFLIGMYEPQWIIKCLVAVSATLVEVLSTSHDNLFIPVPLLLHFLYHSKNPAI